ncbi:hypothetical protein [Streptomyces sp. A5-4]|uniref:hypothetical protein n=1 Tax=Streptomyces sp. A5-4 TaxID=3384771 RepID=UPI003DA8D5BE
MMIDFRPTLLADAPTPPPNSFDWIADGWTFHGEKLSPMVMKDSPRLEIGHTYIMAVYWQPASSAEGDEMPAQWRGLGESSTLPYDDGVIGKGETEGRFKVSAGKEESDTGPDGASLEQTLNGKSTEALIFALQNAKPKADKSSAR